MSADAGTRPFRPLASRLVLTVVSVCAACALLAMAMQGWHLWREGERALANATRDIASGRLPLLTTALWDIETHAVQRQLDEIAAHPQVNGVRLVTAGGQVFAAGRRAPEGHGDAELAVPHPRAGGAPLGQLTLSYDRSYARGELIQDLLRTIIAVSLLSVSTSLLLIRFLRRELSQPLRRIARYTQQLTPNALTQPLDLARPARAWRDDIDLVADGFRTLHEGIARYVGERDAALRELATERDQLDATVQERTADLRRVNGFLAAVSQLSARLIYLPLDDYPAALRAALADTAQGLGARACALAERDAQDGWVWRFAAGDAAQALEGRVLGAPPRGDGWTVMLSHPQDGVATHLLACLDMSPGRDRELELLSKALFGALARWRDLQALESTRQELLRQSRSDALTGLANRRAFDEHKLEELRRARRQNLPLKLVMIDVDHFKRFNDHYGHAAGDDCLARVAQALHLLFQRPGECVARIGGEEFAALLPGVTAEEAQTQGERVRHAIESLGIEHAQAPSGRVSVSVGVATLALHAEETGLMAFEPLMRVADEALYAAKAAGRDAVVARAI